MTASRQPIRRVVLTVLLPPLLTLAATAAEPPAAPRFEADVWPILVAHCSACHGAAEPKGELDLRTVAAMFRGGVSGPAIDKADPDASLLVQRVIDGEMPPGKQRKPSRDEIAVLRAWVRGGVPADNPDAVPPLPPPVSNADRSFWSFRPLSRSNVPNVAHGSADDSPIDAFLLTRLEAKGLSFSAEADRATLVRRLSLDLIGLPPSPAESDEFVADAAPDAYERLVDRLLASPHFGERWGRHWLDVAGYVDTVGFDTDATNIITSEGKWLYRDYVIQSFNRDKPYDRFITEQLAGDELHDWRRAAQYTPEILESLIATGFLRTARDMTHEDVGVIPQNFFGIMHDSLEIVGTGLLGLTLNCARCHTHKFDPIPQEDYYRLMAMLTPAYNPHAWQPVIPFEPKIKDRVLADVAPPQQAAIEDHNRVVAARVEALKGLLADLRRPYETRLFDERLAKVPEPVRADTRAAISTKPEMRTEVQKYLAQKFGGTLTIKPDDVAAALNDRDKLSVKALEASVAAIEAGRRKWGRIQALYDVAAPPATHLLIRGDYETPGPEVTPGFLRVLSRSETESSANVKSPAAGTSGRRSAVAAWMTARDTPAAALLARVMVNRAWQRLFGRGIVPTPDNFGAQGQPPTHPELLEWLSGEFASNEWRLKPLLRQMVCSRAYRQTSASPPLSKGGPGGVASRGPDASNPGAQAAGLADRGVDLNGTLQGADAPRSPEGIDPGNELLWRMPLRRLESEIVRDCILAVSGKLSAVAGGPPVSTDARPDGSVVVAKQRLARPDDQWRRSVYLLSRRAYNLSLLTVFDQPQVATNCLGRDASAVPLQSLTMLNDEFVLEHAGFLAARVEAAGAAAPSEQIEMAFRLALGRRPGGTEVEWSRELLEQQAAVYRGAGLAEDAADHQALVQLCHTLLNTSEFLYAE